MKLPAICRDIGIHRRHLSEVIAPESSIGSGAISLDMERRGTQNPKTIEFFEKIWVDKWRAEGTRIVDCFISVVVSDFWFC